MSTIQGISGQKYIAPQSSTSKSAAKQTTSRATTDVYIPGDSQEGQSEAKAVPFTEGMASALAEKYDVQNMSRNEYTRLVAELRDSGVLTPQEYSIAYGGTMPSDEQGISWPHGSEAADFIQLLQDCEASCADYAANSAQTDGEKANGETLTAAYSKLSDIFQQIEQERVSPSADTLSTEQSGVSGQYTEEVMRLYELLKSDEEYAQKFDSLSGDTLEGDFPVREQLFKEILLSDDELLESLAKFVWNTNAKSNMQKAERNAKYPDRKPLTLAKLPPDYTGYVNEYRNKLEHGGKQGLNSVYNVFQAFMVRKANSEPLTEVEQLVCPEGAENHRVNWHTFDQRMEPVQAEIEKSFKEAGYSFEIDKEYQFYLDTSTFTFSVTGGTEEENALIEKAINYNPRENNLFDPFHTAITALLSHRRDDFSFNPWQLTGRDDAAEMIAKYGLGDVSAEYADKMEQFRTAYELSMLDKNMKYKYGFGVNDISYQNGRWVGKTDEITRIIEEEDADWSFRKETGLTYNSIMRDYTGTPTFEKPVFVFVNGEFKVTYEEWE